MANESLIFLVGASHHTASIAIRERIAVPPARVGELYAELRGLAGVAECLVLSTCNRLEIYCVMTDASAGGDVEDCICRFQGFPAEEFAHHRFHFRNGDVIRHLVEVASGADSQIVGEAEIFGQVKAAYFGAPEGATGPILNRVFQKAFQAVKFIRTHTPIGAGQISIATVAVDLAEKIFGDLGTCRVLVVGTGEVSEKTLKALQSRGVRAITVLSRTRERADLLAKSFGATSGTMDELGALLPSHDIVVGSTTATEPVVTATMARAALRRRAIRPLFLIDMGIPRNFDPGAADVDSVFLYDLDDLARIADENLASRRAAVERCRELARERAARLWEAVGPRLGTDLSVADPGDLTVRPQQTT